LSKPSVARYKRKRVKETARRSPMPEFEHLLSTLKIKDMELKNRIVMPGISTNYASREGFVTQRLIDYLEERAAGGVGLIIVECGSIFHPEGRINVNQLGLYDDMLIPDLKKLINIIHAHDAKVAFQLHHGGKRATRDITGKEPVSSSSIPIKARKPDWGEGEIPRALNIKQIEGIVKAFGNAAVRVKQAGADAVEIHGAHGFLILEFLSPYSNRRADKYGQDIQGRVRFASEIVQEVRRRVGDDFPILFRISADEHVKEGLTLGDAKIIVQMLERVGVDAFNVASGNHDTPEAVIPPAVFSPGFRVHLAEGVKQVVSVPVIASGRINSPELAEQILKSGKADLAAIGRGLLADSEFPNKAAQGKTDEIRKCIACNQGCIDRYRMFDSEGNSLMTCVLNPMVGDEREFAIRRAEIIKRVVVVGGGAAGMEAALVLALRGHEVILLEKENVLGGQLRLAAIVPDGREMKNVVSYFETQLERLGVQIMLGREATLEIIKKAEPQVVILATGAVPIIPAIKGCDGDNVFTAWDVLKGQRVGRTVVVAGGGIVGCETAKFLAEKGKQVTIVEKMSNIALDLGPIRRSLIRQSLVKYQVDIRCDTEIEGIEGNNVITNGRKEIAADTVILAVGKQSNGKLEESLKDYKELTFSVYRVGDCDRSGNLLDAIHSAFGMARRL
jgi:2,4-dienoyl-CoA reductase-like NADH-dependent reductase (Old Yellow Enzyme family)/thioredoxin reductase